MGWTPGECVSLGTAFPMQCSTVGMSDLPSPTRHCDGGFPSPEPDGHARLSANEYGVDVVIDQGGFTSAPVDPDRWGSVIIR
jgi:hypothetical protein